MVVYFGDFLVLRISFLRRVSASSLLAWLIIVDIALSHNDKMSTRLASRLVVGLLWLWWLWLSQVGLVGGLWGIEVIRSFAGWPSCVAS